MSQYAANQNKKNQLLAIGIAICGLSFMFFLGVKTSRLLATSQLSATPCEDYEQIASVSPNDILSAKALVIGTSNAKNKVVLFTDFQCPPCRAEWLPLLAIIRKSKSSSLYVRNLPLTNLHEFAQSAAVAADLAKDRGKFLQMATDLYSTDVSSKWTASSLKQVGLAYSDFNDTDAKAAEKDVAADVLLAKRLGIDATPTILLINSKGQVLRIFNREVLKAMLH